MGIYSDLLEKFDSLETYKEEDGIVIKMMPLEIRYKVFNFYSSFRQHKTGRIPECVGIVCGITKDPSNDNQICFMNLQNRWFDYIHEH